MTRNKTLRTLGLYPAGFSRSASGAAASFRTDLAAPLRDLTVGISPVQSGSGDPSPDNVRPISGWTGANIVRTGKNLFNKDDTPVQSRAYISAATPGKQYTTTAHNNYNIYAVPVVAGITYTFGKIKAFSPMWAFVDANSNVILSGQNNAGETGAVITQTAPAGAVSMLLSVAVAGNYKCDDDLMVVVGGTLPTDYIIYTGQSYPITFPAEAGTVYGGTLDVTAGTLKVTHMAMDEPRTISSITSESYRSSDHTTSFWFYDSPITTIIADDRPFSNMAVFTTSATPDSNINQFGVMTNYAHSWWMRFSAELVGTTIDSIYAYFVEHPFQICAPLATPITYRLTPVEIRTLLGRNNVWADTGDVALSYREGGVGSRSWMLALLAGRRNA